MPTGFYVTARHDKRTAYLVGPFPSKRAAAANVRAVERACEREADHRLPFAAYGVTRLSLPDMVPLPAGRMPLTNWAWAILGEGNWTCGL